MGTGGVRVFDGDVRTVFVRSGFINGDFFLSLKNYDRSLNVVKASNFEHCLQHDQNFCARLKFEAQRKLLYSSVPLQEKRNGRDQASAGKVLLLFWCFWWRQKVKAVRLQFCRQWSSYRPWMKSLQLQGVCVCSGQLPAPKSRDMTKGMKQI